MIYVRNVKDDANGQAKKKWNTAVLAIKRELHNVLGGIDTSALNRVYSLFVNAYNRCIRLLKEMDARYGSFIPSYNNYYDELPIEELVDSDNFTAKLSLVLTEFDKLPKFNVPLVNLNNSIDSYNSSWLDFERTYVTKANNSLESVRKQVNDRGEHLGAVQAYAQKMNRYATEEQRTIAEEAAERVLSEVLTVTAGENAESLGAIEDSMINNDTTEEIIQQVSRVREQSEEISKTEDPAERERKVAEVKEAYDAWNAADQAVTAALSEYNDKEEKAEDAYTAKSTFDKLWGDAKTTMDNGQAVSITFDGVDGTSYSFEYSSTGGATLTDKNTGEVLTGEDAINKANEVQSDYDSAWKSAVNDAVGAAAKAKEAMENEEKAFKDLQDTAVKNGMENETPESLGFTDETP